MKGFNKLQCQVCTRKTWHYDDHCSEHSTWKANISHPVVEKEISTIAVLKAKPDNTPVLVPMRQREVSAKTSNFLPTMKFDMAPDEILCVGCMKPTKVGFMVKGSVYVGLKFIEKETEVELVFDGVNLVEVDRVTKKIPIGERRKGWICTKCAANPETREIKHRDGSTSWEPVVKLDPSSTEHTTLNPGWSREDALSHIPLHYDSLGFVRDEEVDGKAYNYVKGGVRL